jgi:sugar phosphate isomerase/epimerase
MRYGAMNFPIIPVLDEINTFAELGFDYLELTMDQPEAHYSIVSANQAAISKAFQAKDMGIICHLPTFISPADLTDSIRRASITEMRRSLSVAADLGAEKVVMHPPMIGGMGVHVPDRTKAYAFEFLSEMVDLAEGLGITICLENMMPRNLFGCEPSELEEIFWRYPSLKFTLDSGHANLGENGESRLKELVERFSDLIDHVHLSDNRGVYDEHQPLGAGTIDFNWLAKALVEAGYDGTVTFEVFNDNRQLLVESREFWKTLVSREQ